MTAHTWLSAALAVTLTTPAVGAATAPPADSVRVTLPPVEVTALRARDRISDVPAATFVVSRSDLLRAGAPRLSNLLQSVPGLYGWRQSSNGELGVVDPRGFTASGESSYLKVLVDGQDVRDLENGAVDWDWVPMDDVQRIEVVEGSGAWLYGDGSEGGIVNIVRQPLHERFESDCAARFGSFGLRTASLALSGSSGTAAGGVHGQAREVDGWRSHSRERVYGGGGSATTAWHGHELAVDGSYLDANRQDPGSLDADQFATNPEQPETIQDFAHSKRGYVGIRAQSRPGPEPGWALSPYVRAEDTDQIRTLFLQPLAHHTRGWTGGTDATWRGRAMLAGHALLVRSTAQFEHSILKSSYAGYDPDNGIGSEVASTESWRTTAASASSARLELGPGTVARASLRADLARLHAHDGFAGTTTRIRTLTALSPLLGLTQRVGAHGSVYASGSGAFRVPTLNQLYDRRPIQVAPQYFISLSNSELRPQRSVGAELGGRYEVEGGGWATLGAYSSWVRDEIDFDLSTLAYANINKSWHRGIEAGIDWPIGAGVRARASGAWTPTTFRGGPNDKQQINGVPLGNGSAFLEWAPIPQGAIEFGARFAAKQYLDKGEQNPLPAFASWEAGVRASAQRLHATIRALNLFDAKYADSGFIGAFGEERFYPAAPRSVAVSLTLE